MKFFDRVRAVTRGVSAEQLEQAYLNGATSIVDLEMRMREVDRGRFRARTRLA